MADDEENGEGSLDTFEKILATVSEHAAEVSAAGLVTVSGNPELAPVVAGLVKTLRVLVGGHVAARERRRAEDLAGGMVHGIARREEPVEDADRQALGDLLFQSYRAAMDAIDPAVVPYLGVLTAMYADQPLDPFFRGASRTLRDLTAGDLVALRRIVHVARLGLGDPDTTAVHLELNTHHDIPVSVHQVRLGVAHADSFVAPPQMWPEVGNETRWFRLWSLLEAHHLAKTSNLVPAQRMPWKMATSQDQGTPHRFFLVIDRADLVALHELLGEDEQVAQALSDSSPDRG